MSHTYAVKVRIVEEDLACNCPHGRSHKRNNENPCKHVRAVEVWLEKQTPETRRRCLLANEL